MLLWQVVSVAGVAVLVAFVFLALGRLPNHRTSRPLLGMGLTALLWAAGDYVTSLSQDMFWEQTGIAILYTGSIFMPPFWWMLTLGWAADRGVALPFEGDRWIRWPFYWAGAMWIVMLSNPWHGLFITPVIGDRNLYEPLWWAVALPNYALVVAALAVALSVLHRVGSRASQRQAIVMGAAGVVTLLANWAYVLHENPSQDGTLAVLALSAAIVVVGLYREGLFGLLPVALPMIAEQDPDGLLVLRAGGRVAWANPRARELLAPVDLTEGTRIPEALVGRLLEPDGSSPDELEAGFEEIWWQELIESSGRLFRWRDGARWVRLRAHTIPGRAGQIVALCLRVRDVTEEERLEAELRRARRLESVAGLARGVAHDFRNLLATTRGNAELMASEVGDDPVVVRRLERILDATRQAGELAHQLQLYSGGGEAFRSRLDLSEIARECADLDDGEARPDAFVEIELASEPLLVDADRTQLRQVVSNLYLNAHEALPESGGEIRVQSGRAWIDPPAVTGLILGREQPAGEYAWLRVADNGSGIDAEAQERIFEPFFSTKGKRRGIGLSTVLGIARSHDALLELETRAGAGSAFTLYLRLESIG